MLTLAIRSALPRPSSFCAPHPALLTRLHILRRHLSTAMPPKSILIVGAHRGLGLALVKRYAEVMQDKGHIFATVEQPVDSSESESSVQLSNSAPRLELDGGVLKTGDYPKMVDVIQGVDCTQKDCGEKVVAGLKGKKVDRVLYVSGVVFPEVSPG